MAKGKREPRAVLRGKAPAKSAKKKPATKRATPKKAAPKATINTLMAVSASHQTELSLRSSSSSAATLGRLGTGPRVIEPNVQLGAFSRQLAPGSYWYQFNVQGTKAFSLGVSTEGGRRSQIQTYPDGTTTDTYSFRVP